VRAAAHIGPMRIAAVSSRRIDVLEADRDGLHLKGSCAIEDIRPAACFHFEETGELHIVGLDGRLGVVALPAT